MTILSVCQNAAARLVSRKPTTFFSSQKPFEVELCSLVQEAAGDIAKAHDWRTLMVLAEHQGDGSKIAFDFPQGYDRMPTKGNVHSSTWQQSGYTPARDLDQWINLQTYLSAGTPGYWIILEGKMQIYPPMGTSEIAKYYFVTNEIFTADNGASKAVVDKDADSFRLDERVLTLSLIWRWRDLKGLDYSEALENYDRALSQSIGTDKGTRILKEGRARLPYGVELAFPGVINR